MNKSVFDILLSALLICPFEYEGYFINDDRVQECLMDMYFYMLYNGMDNDEKKEEYFQEFERKYNDLDEKQQNIVKVEYRNIIEAQKKKEEKVKKKGMINNE